LATEPARREVPHDSGPPPGRPEVVTAPAGAVPGFLPSRDALHFANSWPSQPDVVIDLPVAGKLKIGDASRGLCGGMVFAVRDLFEAHLPPPPDTTPPPSGSPLYGYIVRRLFDSFDLPGGVLRYYRWMNTPDEDRSFLGVTRRGLAWLTIVEEWPKIRADVDAGRPSPLGLVTVQSANPLDLGMNHQVLAYGYELDGTALTLRVYDPNTDPASADGVALSLDTAEPAARTPISHSVAIATPVRGFFRVRYGFADPAGALPGAG